MFIIFGWLKEEIVVKPLIDTYCYHCNHSTTWFLCKETEWVTFFDIRTIPLINKYHLVCEKCGDVFELDKKLSRKIVKLDKLNQQKSKELHDSLVSEMEKFQLKNKSPRQLEYIKAMRPRDKG